MLSPTDLDVDSLLDCIPDWPKGPLDNARSKASFDWKVMKLVLDGDTVVRFKHKVWSTLASDPIFKRTPWEEYDRNEERRLTFARLKKLVDYKLASEEEYLNEPHKIPAFVQAVGQFSWSLIVKRVLSYEYFIVSCKMDNGDRDNSLVNDIMNFNALGAISITELAHGSNTKELQTTATYDPTKQCFVLNTPRLEATKVWSGVLGQSATHVVVFAQLYTPDGSCHGLHSFMVPIRDPKTFQPYPGLIIGDMGGKVGLNGLDNGFMTFKNYCIPKASLMNRNSDVTSDGKYTSKVKDESKRFGITLGVLSSGRIFIILFSISNIQSALSIAVRYSAVRRQFGPTNGEEIPVLEYQSQQWRLIPYIAASYVFHNFFGSLFLDYVDFFVTAFNANGDTQMDMGAEIHSLSSCGKAVATWMARDAIQECRECCGGHGYLKAAGFGELRNDHDANTTYEGDNNVLLQQTSNYLIKFYKEKVEEGKPISSYFGSVNYLDSIETILSTRCPGNLDDIPKVLEAYRFLVCYLLKSSYLKLQEQTVKMGDSFDAKNATQVYYLRSLAIVFFEAEALDRFQRFLTEFSVPDEISIVLKQLGLLYGLWSLEKHLAVLYESGYFTSLPLKPTQSTLSSSKPILTGPSTNIKEMILQLCNQLKDNAVALVDSYAPPDHILNSSLGASDGQIYQNIFAALENNKGAFGKPEWLEQIANSPSTLSGLKSKL
uniref:Acyl-coenzyme A oxidase n=1 Tax=Tetranychus urticae TaxID=32264 RepID=T1L1B6_TETUR